MDRLPVGWDEGPGLVASVWRFRWLVAAVALAGALAGVGVSSVQPVMYEGSSRILLADRSSGNGGGQADPDRYVRNQAAFIMSPLVLERTVALTGGRVTVKQLRERLVAEPSKESDLITVRVRDATAKGAVELAEAVGQAYRDTAVRQAQQAVARTVARLQSDQKTIQDQLKELDARLRASPNDVALRAQREEVARQFTLVVGRIEQARLADAAGDPVAVREKAELPEEPVQPQPMRLAAVGGLLGMVVAAGLAWWLAWRRQPTHSQPQPEWTHAGPLAAPLLGEIPDFAELVGDGQVPTATDPESAAGRAYRALAASLQSVLDRTGTRALVVTSPDPGDGKTLTSVNLAVALGQSGQHVVLVDADERQRGLSQLCNLDGQPGLTDLAGEAGEAAPIDYCLWLPTFTSIQVIPAGAPVADSAGFVQGPSFSRAMVQVRQHASLTMIDTPALLSAPDALTIAEQVEGVVLVVRPETSAVTLIEARRRLDGAGARLLGYVLNRSGSRRDGHRDDGNGHEPPGTTKELTNRPMQLPGMPRSAEEAPSMGPSMGG